MKDIPSLAVLRIGELIINLTGLSFDQRERPFLLLQRSYYFKY